MIKIVCKALCDKITWWLLHTKTVFIRNISRCQTGTSSLIYVNVYLQSTGKPKASNPGFKITIPGISLF